MRPCLKPINRSTRSETVLQQVRQAILNNSLKPGDRLIESELAKRLVVSRTPIREAIRTLEAKGLVTRLDNGYAVVAERSLASMIDIFHVRIALESYAARVAAETINEEQLNHLTALCAESKKLHKRGDLIGLKQIGDDFHNAIVKITHNQQFAKHLREIYELINIYRDRLYSSPQGTRIYLINHSEIVEALRAHDGNAAQDLMRKHLLIALENIKTLWDGNE